MSNEKTISDNTEFKTDEEILRKENEYPNHLRGYGNRPLKKPKGFRGSKTGAANEGRVLSREEVEKIQEQMRKEGKL